MTTNQYVATDCQLCNAEILPPTLRLTGSLCYQCREKQAKEERKGWCIAPISNKCGYTIYTDFSLLKQLNPKRTEA
jgi:hypothetical protein